jgi:hypothetical protein
MKKRTTERQISLGRGSGSLGLKTKIKYVECFPVKRQNMVRVGMYCRGLTRATYILCIEHPRPKRLSRELNPGPPALQANTLCKEPFEKHCWLLFGTSACTTTAPPQATMSQALDWGSWLSLTRTRICLIGRVEVRIAREGARRSNLSCVRGSRALEPQSRVRIASHRGHHYVGAWHHLHPLHRASETEASQ